MLIVPFLMCPDLTQLLWCLISPRETIVFEIEEIAQSRAFTSHSTECKLGDTVNLVTGTFGEDPWLTFWLYKPGPGRRAAVIHVHQNDLDRQLICWDQRWSDENRLDCLCLCTAGTHVKVFLSLMTGKRKPQTSFISIKFVWGEAPRFITIPEDK